MDKQTKPRISYCATLLRLIEISFPGRTKIINRNYTARGVEAEFVDLFDNQLYHITIESKHEYKGE